MRDLRAKVKHPLASIEVVEIFGERLPAPGDAVGECRSRNVLHPFHQLDEVVALVGRRWGETDPAVSHHCGGDSVPTRRGEFGIPCGLRVVMGMGVNEPRGDQPAVGVNFTVTSAEPRTDVSDARAVNGNIGDERRASAAVDDVGVPDHQIMHGPRLDGSTAATVLLMSPDAGPSPSPAPQGMRLVSDAKLTRRAEGRQLIGGVPLRVVNLRPDGAALVEDWLRGIPVGKGEGERRLARRLLDNGMLHPFGGEAGPDLGPVAAVVPMHNDLAGAEAAVSALAVEPVYVVDDGSEQPVSDRWNRDGVRVIRREQCGGPGAARNTGMFHAHRDGAALVAFVDCDVRVESGWVERLVHHFADPMVAAVAPRVRSKPGPTVLDRYEERFSPLDMGRAPAPVREGGAVPFVPAAALIVRVDAFLSVGGFDEALRFGEDVDLVWRLNAAGWTVRYDPAVVVTHRPRDRWRGWLTQRRRYGTAAAPLAERHGSALAPARLSPEMAAAVVGVFAVPARLAIPLIGTAVRRMVRRLRPVVGPASAVSISAAGVGHAVRSSASAVVRAWWPLAVLGGLFSRRLRWRLVVWTALLGLDDWRRFRPRLPVGVTVVLRALDHGAYGLGVWQGILRRRSLAAIRPVVVRPSLVPDSTASSATTNANRVRR